jgi:resuscitation-promoting factor RpfB
VLPQPRQHRARQAPPPRSQPADPQPANPQPAKSGPLPPPHRHAAGRHAHAGPPASPVLTRLLPRALVLTVLAGGMTAFVSCDKSIRLRVDGEPRTLHTFAADVGDVLDQQDIQVGAHDTVAPAPGTALDDGEEVTVRYGRRLTLDLDGRHRHLWTTATTVRDALRELGVRAEGADISVSRDQRIGRHGLRVRVRTERSIAFLVDGRRLPLRTNAATVAEALDQAGIVLSGEDSLSVPAFSFPRDGQTISVLRIKGTTVTREEPVPYRTVRRPDPHLFTGTELVVTPGREGVRRVTYVRRTVNGVRLRPRRVAVETLHPPVTQVITYGTRALPTSVSGAEGLNWKGLAACEAGGRPTAVDPSGTYGGLYQFDAATWHSLGGSGRPERAPAAEQTYRAKKLYVRQGAGAWPVCGRRLFT